MEWIQHFTKHTAPQKKGVYQLLLLDEHGSHYSTDFKQYCKAKNIITLCMPPYLSYLLQLLNVKCFSLLKKAYSTEIAQFSKAQITYINKTKFFLTFHAAHKKVFKPETI